jgi:hypothetical protein
MLCDPGIQVGVNRDHYYRAASFPTERVSARLALHNVIGFRRRNWCVTSGWGGQDCDTGTDFFALAGHLTFSAASRIGDQLALDCAFGAR